MSSFNDVLEAKKQQLLTTAKENKTTIVKTVVNHKGYKCTTPGQVDWLVQQAEAAGLVTTGWRAWHSKQVYLMGIEAYQRCISMAKDNKNPTPKLFSYLLRLEQKKPTPEAGKVTNT